MSRWPFGRKPRREHELGEYTEPSFTGALIMLVVSIVVIAALWLVYSWALNQPHVDDPNGFVRRALALATALRVG